MHLSRRHFLAGTAGTALLAACGGDDASPTTSAPESLPDGVPEGLAVFAFFDAATLVAGTEVRAPLGVGDIDGPLSIEASPAEITVTVTTNGEQVATSIVGLRSEGLPRGYYPLRFTPPEPGLYDLAVEADGLPPLETTIELIDPSLITIPGAGDRFPVLDTPTVDDSRGVTPICTREPPCSLHEQNLPDLLAGGRPAVVMISTPKFCSTAICGPVLDLLIDEAEGREGLAMIHAEVYADPETDTGTVAPIVTEMALTFEPSVVFIDAGGQIVERLDFVFDASELSESLDRLTA